jgi:hypothetical protein
MLRVGGVDIEERSFVAQSAPLDDGQRQIAFGERLAAEARLRNRLVASGRQIY